jgi:hypothetical protein
METQSWEELGDLVIRFDASRFNPHTIRTHAERFSTERFAQEFNAFLHAIPH